MIRLSLPTPMIVLALGVILCGSAYWAGYKRAQSALEVELYQTQLKLERAAQRASDAARERVQTITRDDQGDLALYEELLHVPADPDACTVPLERLRALDPIGSR